MVEVWRNFWIRETGTGQQVAQLHEMYDNDDDGDFCTRAIFYAYDIKICQKHVPQNRRSVIHFNKKAQIMESTNILNLSRRSYQKINLPV